MPLAHRRLVAAVGAAAEALVRDCAARDRIAGEFVECAEELLEVDGVRLALFALEPRRTLAALVADGQRLPAGACVTLLVPLAETIARAHAAGVAHGRLDLGACIVDARGRPQVEDWSGAVDLDGVSALRADLARAADLRSLGRIADALLAHAEPARSGDLAGLVDGLAEGAAPRDAANRLIDALFAWARPEPIPDEALVGRAQRTGASTSSPIERRDADDAPAARSIAEHGLLDESRLDEPRLDKPSLLAEPGLLDAPAAGSTIPRLGRRARLAELRMRLVGWVGEVRPALWLAVAGAGAAIVLAGLIIPGTGTRPADRGDEASAAVAVASPPQPALEPRPVDSGPGFGEAPDAEPAAEAPEVDGLAAAAELATLRDRCLLALDAECLRGLFAPGAPGLAADLESITAADAGERRLVAEEWLLAADLGDIEIVRAADDSGALSVERTAEGWRLREVWLGG